MFAQNRALMESGELALAAIAPRGVGVTRWAQSGSMDETQISRRFALLGQTEDGQRVWDVRRAVSTLRGVPEFRASKLTLHGQRASAGIALYAGLYEPEVAAFDLWHMPWTHHEAPIFLNVLRVLDAPQAVALALPRNVTLHVKAKEDRAPWEWPLALQKSLGLEGLRVKVIGE
jgi:hypothetical protein